MCQQSSKNNKQGIAAAVLIKIVRGYQLTFSAIFGRTCRHLPSCSSYAIEGIMRFGAWRGFWLGLARTLRCNPWGSEGYDPVPDELSDHHWRFWRYGVWKI